MHIQLHSRINKDTFSLDSSGIAGFFRGEEAFAAMNGIHLIPAQRWLGWYNSPGSYFLAKKYGMLPNLRFWNGLFPGPTVTPAKLFELDGKAGPRYTRLFSGCQLATTGHLSYLVARYIGGIHRDLPDPEAEQSLPQKHITISFVNFADFDLIWNTHPKVPSAYFPPIPFSGMVVIMATILYSLVAGVLAALYNDWFSFSMIFYGVYANGITLAVLGTGDLYLDVTKEDSLSSDGIMWNENQIILLQGSKRTINTILHSRYRLGYGRDSQYHSIGCCSILLLAQFLLQLFLIPQGILVGQILFLSTLAMSWICNGYLASFDSEDMQTELLFKIIRGPTCYTVNSDSWDGGAASIIAYFQDYKGPKPDSKGILDQLVPNNAPAWDLWKWCIYAATEHEKYCNPSGMIQDPPSQSGPTTSDAGSVDDPMYALKARFDKLGTEEEKVLVKEALKRADKAFESVNLLKKTVKESGGISVLVQ